MILVVPAIRAARHRTRESSIVAGPSSTPGMTWQWRSITLPLGEELVPTGLELVLRLLVIVVTSDVEPVAIGSPRLHRLSRSDQPQHQIREIEPLPRLDQVDRPRRKAVDAHRHLVVE